MVLVGISDLGRSHRVLLAEVVGDLAGVDGDGDGGIEFLELGRARLGAVLADIGLGEVKLRAQIGELARGGVLDGDTFDPREDDVLGDLRAPKPFMPQMRTVAPASFLMLSRP